MFILITSIVIIGLFLFFALSYKYLLNSSEEKQVERAGNKKTSLYSLNILKKSKYDSVKKEIIKNPKATEEMLFEYVINGSLDVKKFMAEQENLSPLILYYLYQYNSNEPLICEKISQNKTLINYIKEEKEEREKLRALVKEVLAENKG